MSIKTKEIKPIKNGWYNIIIKEPLKGKEKNNMQYIIENEGNIGVASIKPLTKKEIEKAEKDINFLFSKNTLKKESNKIYFISY
jgi:hypothetical protein